MAKHAGDRRNANETKARTKASFATRILWFLVCVTLITAGIHLLFQYLNLIVFSQQVGQFYELSNRFDLDDESSVPTWFAQLLFLAIGVSALMAAYLQAHKPARRLWALIAAIGLIFSLDEISGLHERILQSLHVLFFQDATSTGLANAWWVVLPFVLLASVWLLWRAVYLLPRRTIRLFVVSGVTFLLGAVITDLLVVAAPRETFLNQGIFVAVEETLELLGTVIGLYAILDYLETQHYDVISKAIKQLKSAPSRRV